MNKKSFKLSFFILGSVIGAGFASGKEIATFFSRFGYLSIGLAVICGYLFYVLCKLFLQASYLMPISHFGDVSKQIFKKNSSVFNLILVLCFTVVTGSMLAGSNALGVIAISSYKGYIISIITAILCAIIVLGGLKTISKINFFLVPIMVVFMLITCVLSYFFIEPTNDMIFNTLQMSDYFMGIGSTILYVCLNMLTSGLLLMQIGKDYSKKEINSSSKFFGIIVEFLILGVSVAIINSNFNIFESEMPLIALAINMSKAWSIVISIIVWLAIFTTIVSTVYIISNYIKQFCKSYLISVIITLCSAFLISILGFANIVKYIYPIMGVLGLILVMLIAKQTNKASILIIFDKQKR